MKHNQNTKQTPLTTLYTPFTCKTIWIQRMQSIKPSAYKFISHMSNYTCLVTCI